MPRYLIGVDLKPKSLKDGWRLLWALSSISRKDASLSTSTNWLTGRAELQGVSEDQLNSIISRLKNEHKIDFDASSLEVFNEVFVMNGGPRLREPVMLIKVITPEEYLGSVIGDLNVRRGQVTALEDSDSGKIVTGLVPLEQMFGFTSKLNSMTRWKATYTMELDHFEEVILPPDHPPKRPAMIMRK